MTKDSNGIWVITQSGDLFLCVGCKINGPGLGYYTSFSLVLLTIDRKEHKIASSEIKIGEYSPDEFLVKAREIIVKGIIESKTGKFDFRTNIDLMELLRKSS